MNKRRYIEYVEYTLPVIGLVVAVLFIAWIGGCDSLIDPKFNSKHLWYSLPNPDMVAKKNISIVVGSEDLAPHIDQWVREASRRYDDFILIMIHGRDLFDWAEDSIELIAEARARHGEGRRIIYVVCNGEGVELTVPGVSYARRNVWATPDSYVSTAMNIARDEAQDLLGNVFEMIETEAVEPFRGEK